MAVAARASWFQRILLPALAFKAVVIGGGYATGRELAQFFLSSGPSGGLLGMMLATGIWSLVCMLTFLFARMTASRDYQAFFARLLGRFSPAFEIAYFLFIILILAVFGAAASAIGHEAFGLPAWTGSVLLMLAIAVVVTHGAALVEHVFKYVSIFLYATYAIFLVLCLTHFGDRIGTRLAENIPIGGGWALGGITYAGYNIIGAVVILPVARHFTSDRDAVVAGLLCGPLAMAPAFLFLVCMIGDYPQITRAILPSDVLLRQIDSPVFHVVFQAMILAALLESGTGLVHAVVERVAGSWRARTERPLPRQVRSAIALALLAGSMFLADRVGLVSLISRGYGVLAWVFIGIYVLPLLTVGWAMLRRNRSIATASHHPAIPQTQD
ncbi:MAG: hypothetical protein KGJ57_15405 [Sphingomonadales bacterium]|nr:hypothetical protein [Sphingomonadales bacterium]MDE2170789.1 hypothetical protein [Sphingomonadales bacterium]